MANHSERKHALLSASGSSRWLNCTPSARLEDQHGVKTTSIYAEEGTLAHEVAELFLRLEVLKEIDDQQYVDRLSVLMQHARFNDEMLIEVPKYVDYCSEQFESAKAETPDAVILVEQKIDLRGYIPDGHGLCDTVIVADGVLEVIDLKYGKGLRVDAVGNTQLMIYGLGAYDKYSMIYDIHTVKVTVVQPRLDNVSSWTMPVDELLTWADELKKKAQVAYAGEGELTVGSWCKFCSIKARCKAIAADNMAVVDFKPKNVDFITDKDIALLLTKIPALLDWVNGIQEYAYNEAVNKGKVWPGFKLVEGVSRRKWQNEAVVVKILRERFTGLDDGDIFNTSLKSITDIEKLVTKKKFTELFSDVVIKPQGKPALVPIEDKRPALGIEQAKADFTD